MKNLPATHPHEFPRLDSTELRARFLVEGLFDGDRVSWVNAQDDRLLLGGITLSGPARPVTAPPQLGTGGALCDRRELAVVPLTDRVTVIADGTPYALEPLDVLYVGLGTAEVSLEGIGRVYLVSAPAHRAYPTTPAGRQQAHATELGEPEHANRRTIRRHIHTEGVASANLVLGVTTLHPGSVWNTMPPHTHGRRTEVYLYTGLGADDHVVHLAGPPDSTRPIIVADDQAVISPGWSIHSGAGTRAYSFIWAMAGENQDYADMDPVAVADLR
ncbi:5-dehydro-4-deoxy-D-glucuronate isomerase [Microlunatus sp. GCM10028923]|uniref:5-dehydro-4-deoxy-D-glucuronate isomerase n=1 Tax=Microlunatus sp. GCM10028923 TaxID=3273400 RepID=UPI00362216CC